MRKYRIPVFSENGFGIGSIHPARTTVEGISHLAWAETLNRYTTCEIKGLYFIYRVDNKEEQMVCSASSNGEVSVFYAEKAEEIERELDCILTGR